MLKTTVMSRWIVINALITALFVSGYYYGLLDPFLTDETFLTHAIATVGFSIVLFSGLVTWRVATVWGSIDTFKTGYYKAKKADMADEYQAAIIERFSRSMSFLSIAGPLLVGLGLLGTVIGIRLGFVDVSVDAVGDADAAGAVLITLLSGLATALNTTLAGMVGMLWNIINLHMIKQEFSKIYAEIVLPVGE